jgi:hypothetical protein
MHPRGITGLLRRQARGRLRHLLHLQLRAARTPAVRTAGLYCRVYRSDQRLPPAQDLQDGGSSGSGGSYGDSSCDTSSSHNTNSSGRCSSGSTRASHPWLKSARLSVAGCSWLGGARAAPRKRRWSMGTTVTQATTTQQVQGKGAPQKGTDRNLASERQQAHTSKRGPTAVPARLQSGINGLTDCQ